MPKPRERATKKGRTKAGAKKAKAKTPPRRRAPSAPKLPRWNELVGEALAMLNGTPVRARALADALGLGENETLLALESLADDPRRRVRRVGAGYYAWVPPR